MRGARNILIILFGLIPWWASSAYALPENLHGSIQLTGVDTDNNGSRSQSLSQRYNVNWQRRFSPYLIGRGLFTYDHFGLDLGEGGNVWNRQMQPSGDIQWAHSAFSVLMSALRREASTNDHLTDVIQHSYVASAGTRSLRYPIITARYALDEFYNAQDRRLRDTQERQFQGGVSYARSRSSLYYQFARRESSLHSSNLDVTETSHQLRWTQWEQFWGDRVRVDGEYSLNHRRQTTRLIGADTTVRVIDVAATLYADDATPELGALDSLPGLGDGIVDQPTEPAIDIGRGIGNHNLGIDFGFVRSVRGLYVYTDRPSGSSLGWQVYTSPDNLVWTRVTATVRVAYNPAFARYEIAFDNVEARYIKAVNVDLNDVLTVLVTEIEALEAVGGDRVDNRRQTVHRATGGIRYRVSSTLQTSADIMFRHEPAGGFSNSRDQLFYSLSATHRPSEKVMQSVGFRSGWDEFVKAGVKEWNTSVTYTLRVRPLKESEIILSALTRNNRFGRLRIQESNNVSLQARGTALPGLQVALEGGYSRNNQFVARQTFDTWTWKGSLNAALTSTLQVGASTLYQTTHDVGMDVARIRRLHTASLDYRATESISMRGELTVGDDQKRNYLSQDYTLSWRMSSKLSASAVATIMDTDAASRSERGIVQMNYELSGQTHVYANYSATTGEGRVNSRVDAIQLGLRTGF